MWWPHDVSARLYSARAVLTTGPIAAIGSDYASRWWNFTNTAKLVLTGESTPWRYSIIIAPSPRNDSKTLTPDSKCVWMLLVPGACSVDVETTNDGRNISRANSWRATLWLMPLPLSASFSSSTFYGKFGQIGQRSTECRYCPRGKI